MQWRVWAVAGEALNFGGRRFETILRVSWLPLLLILLMNMVTVFVTLSLAVDRPVTFAETGSYANAEANVARLMGQAWERAPGQMLALSCVAFAVNLLLLSSFMAPLIRYAATGVKPDRGLIHTPFGAEQIRYAISSTISGYLPLLLLLGPGLITLYFLNDYISESYIAFPSENSLHTVKTTSLNDHLSRASELWFAGMAIPMWLLAIPILIPLFLVLYGHFHPRNRPGAANSQTRPLLRATSVTALIIAFAVLLLWLGIGNLPIFTSVNEYLPQGQTSRLPVTITLTALSGLLIYFNLRMFAYPGYAVLDRSLGFMSVLRASRGWNLIRMAGLMILFTLVTVGVQYVMNISITRIIAPALVNLMGFMISATRFLNSGFSADWVVPLVQWTWTLTRVLLNIAWMMFSYGALAGLYGRLYVHSSQSRPYMPE